jgi:hypothetical protein
MNGEMTCGSQRACFTIPALPLPVQTKKNHVNRSGMIWMLPECKIRMTSSISERPVMIYGDNLNKLEGG